MAQFDYFVIFAEMRTGSNLLEENINQFPDITSHGEVFNPHFIGYPVNEDLFGVTQADREENPLAAIQAIQANTDGLAGFRFFHDHDARIFEHCIDDPRCAKIILNRNPIDSFVSWKIASATGQWKLTNATHQKATAIEFNADEFEGFMQNWQDFQIAILNRMQKSGQTAFYIAYEDLQDVEVLNGMAKFLGSGHRIEALSKRLKKQNPAPLSEKVQNFEDMVQSVARMDRFNLNRTPNFEPRRGAMVPQYVAAARAPLLYLPIKCGPTELIEQWMADLDHVTPDDLRRNLSQKDLRQWKRQNKGNRSFTVVRHPVMRVYDAFCKHILDTGPLCYTEVRKTLRRVHNVPIPQDQPDASFTPKDMRAAFVAFLTFLKANLSGQTALRVDPAWASQSHVIQGFADFAPPDVIVREEVLEDELAFLAAQTGTPYAAVRDMAPVHPIELSEIYDGHVEGLVRDAYQKDYLAYGFGPLNRI